MDIFPKAVEIFQSNLADPQADPILDSARSLYGTYGKTMSVYNLPFNLMVPLTACIVPRRVPPASPGGTGWGPGAPPSRPCAWQPSSPCPAARASLPWAGPS